MAYLILTALTANISTVFHSHLIFAIIKDLDYRAGCQFEFVDFELDNIISSSPIVICNSVDYWKLHIQLFGSCKIDLSIIYHHMRFINEY